MFFFFFFKQKTAYEIRPCDWSSDVCSSDLPSGELVLARLRLGLRDARRGGGHALDKNSVFDRRSSHPAYPEGWARHGTTLKRGVPALRRRADGPQLSVRLAA